MARTKINLSVDADTAAKLKQLASERHTTVSQLVTDWTWRQSRNQTADTNNTVTRRTI